MTVLAIDQGTSGTKALVQDGSAVLGVVELPVSPSYAAGGVVEVDPLDLEETVVEAGRQALEVAGNPSLSAVALANQGETVLAWDPVSRAPLSPAIVWQDRRAEGICSALGEDASWVAERTGLVLDAYFSAPKMAWLRRNVSTEGIVTTTDSWLMHRLTGELVTDVTTASRSLLLDIDRVTWDPELLALFGLEHETLPRLVANDEVAGVTDAFGGPTPVGGLIVDQQAALAAQQCLERGSAKCTFGTGAFLLGNTGGHAVRSANGLTSSVAWSVRGATTYCLDGQAYTAGSAVRWMVSAGLLSAPENLDAECGAETSGAVFVPGLAGFAAPWWRSTPSGAFVGLSLSAHRAELVRAVVEGLACQVAVLVGELERESGSHIPHLRVDGGLTRSRALMQATADLLQRPVEVSASPHATALGAAAMGRLAVDPALTLAEAVGATVPAANFEPTWSPDRCAATLATWRTAVEAVLSREEMETS